MAADDRGGAHRPNAALPRTPCPDRHAIRVEALAAAWRTSRFGGPPYLRFAGLDGPGRGYSKGVADGP